MTTPPHDHTLDDLARIIGGPQAHEAARQLRQRFGTLGTIFNAMPIELQQVKGIGPSAAERLHAVFRLGRAYYIASAPTRASISSPADAANLLMYDLQNKEQEYLYVILLDTRNRVIGQPVEVYHGSLNTSLIRIAEILREAIRVNAASIIVVHNHPSGDPSPSPEDVAVTRAISDAGKLMDIQLLDHLVIGHQRFVSLKERGLGFPA